MRRLMHIAIRIWNQRYDQATEATLGAIHQLNVVFPTSVKINQRRWRAYLPHAVLALRDSMEHCVQ